MFAPLWLRQLQHCLLPRRSRNAGNASRRTPPRRRVRLGLEVLEDRTVPSTLEVGAGQAYTTIQSAVNAAASGDTILIDPGTYQENVTITTSNLTLRGPNAGINPNTGTRGPEAIVEPGANDPTGGSVFSVEASNVTIDGLTIDGSNPNLSGGVTLNGVEVNAANGVSNANTYIDHLVVRDNIIRNFNENGVLGDMTAVSATPSGFNLITENLIDNIPSLDTGDSDYPVGWGILLADNFYASVTDNVLTRVRTGIQTDNFSQANPDTDPNAALIDGNTVTFYVRGVFDNLQYQDATPWTISNNDLTYIPLDATADYNGGLFIFSIQGDASATIQNNNVTGAKYGIELWNNPTTNPIAVQCGTLTNNQVGIWATNNDANYGAGDATTAIVDGVTITGSTTDGVLIESDTGTNAIGLTVQNSTIATGPVGVEVKGGLSSFVLTGDTIAGNQTGVQLDADVTATSDDHINGSAISGNTVAGLVHNGDSDLDVNDNYWGSPNGPTYPPLNPGGDGQTILDSLIENTGHNGTVSFSSFQPTNPLPAATTTTADNATAPFSESARNVTLTATVSSDAGNVNEGTVTFTIVDGQSHTIGTATTSDTVRGGQASVTYLLPAGTALGSYTIEAVYNPGADFTGSADNTHTLTVGAAATATTASKATATFNGNNQNVILTATVSSGAGPINEGSVTFTIKQGNTILGTATSGAVRAGQASAVFVLPGGTLPGSYTIEADYSDPAGRFGASGGTASLIVNASATTTQLTNVTIVPNLAGGTAQVTLTARVSSLAGLVNEGSVTFTFAGHSAQAAVVNGTASVQLAVSLLNVIGNQTVSLAYTDSGAFGPNGTAATVALNRWNALAPANVTFTADGGEHNSIPFFVAPLEYWHTNQRLTEFRYGALDLQVGYVNINGVVVVTLNGVPWQVQLFSPQGQFLGAASLAPSDSGLAILLPGVL